MADLRTLKTLVHSAAVKSNDDRLLLLIGSSADPISRAEMGKLARGTGLSSLEKNLASYLSRNRALIITTAAGYELNDRGVARVRSLGGGSVAPAPLDPLLSQLRAAAQTLASPETKSFVLEAIACLDGRLYRAGIVLSWVGAVAVLQEFVVSNHLAAFNIDAAARFPKDWKKPAKTTQDLGRLKESDFLLVLDSISMISKNVKQELEGCLKLRNSCGHPSGLKVGEHKAAAHVETLLQNVYLVFS